MVQIDQVKRGIALFLEREVAPSMQGWQKLAFSTAAGVAISKIETAMQKVPFGIVENGMVDVDLIYTEAKKHFNEPVPVQIPLIGTITFTADELDALYSAIVGC